MSLPGFNKRKKKKLEILNTRNLNTRNLPTKVSRKCPFYNYALRCLVHLVHNKTLILEPLPFHD